MKVPEKLKTERLILRRLVPEDVQPFYDFISDDDATRYMVFTPEQRTYEGAKGMIDYSISAYDTDEAVFVLAIADQAGNYLGSLGAAPTESPQEVEFFYTLLPQYHGKGYATEATRKLMRYLFETTSAEALVAYVFHDNAASIRVLERLGLANMGDVMREGNAGLKYKITRDEFGGK